MSEVRLHSLPSAQKLIPEQDILALSVYQHPSRPFTIGSWSVTTLRSVVPTSLLPTHSKQIDINLQPLEISRFESTFYDGGRTSGQAGDFVFKTVVPALKSACPGKKLYITEFVLSTLSSTFFQQTDCFFRSGWPSRGAKNGVANPSVSDENNAILNLNCACRDDTSVSVYAFEYDDQLWKNNDNERSFGIFGKITLNGGAFNPC